MRCREGNIIVKAHCFQKFINKGKFSRTFHNQQTNSGKHEYFNKQTANKN